MTLFDALPKDDEKNVALPVGGMKPDGTMLPGATSPAFVQSVFGDFAGKTVPLSAEDYQGLLAISSPLWTLNWETWRDDGLI